MSYFLIINIHVYIIFTVGTVWSLPLLNTEKLVAEIFLEYSIVKNRDFTQYCSGGMVCSLV